LRDSAVTKPKINALARNKNVKGSVVGEMPPSR